jgi:hypothetical protein
MRRFDENYGLASTQSLKNKDIPEGGAKGTIVRSVSYMDFTLSPLTDSMFLFRIAAELGSEPSPVFRTIRRRKHSKICCGLEF